MTARETQLVQIEKPVYGGAFLARVEGKAVFVPLTLPGEQARVRMVEEKRGYALAETEQIVIASAARITPGCQHFGACGGCHYQHTDYESQLGFKQAILHETLERGGLRTLPAIAVCAAQPWGYRNRIRLALDAAGNPGYRGRRSHSVIPVKECPIAAPILVNAAVTLAATLRETISTLRPSEISLFRSADENTLLASIFVASPGKSSLDDLARTFQERIPELRGLELIVEGRKSQPPRTLARWGSSSLAYRAAGFDYRVDHGSFFQVNRWLVDELVARVTAGRSGRLAWDLFAGVGLFARQLTASFEHVIAVESAPSAIDALKENLRNTRGEAVQSDTLAFLRRQPPSIAPDLIVVDPPRTGLGSETTAQLARLASPAIVYVSCDPATLARDLGALLSSGYAIESITLVDLFPQTFHLETVVALRRA
ncbi:MAG: 23S rRNA (uracil(1939)-C(5))-methyltransferase RlmD [Terracidiphilus sp.]